MQRSTELAPGQALSSRLNKDIDSLKEIGITIKRSRLGKKADRMIRITKKAKPKTTAKSGNID